MVRTKKAKKINRTKSRTRMIGGGRENIPVLYVFLASFAIGYAAVSAYLTWEHQDRLRDAPFYARTEQLRQLRELSGAFREASQELVPRPGGVTVEAVRSVEDELRRRAEAVAGRAEEEEEAGRAEEEAGRAEEAE